MLTTKQILDQALSGIRDNSPAMRTKALGWLNRTLQALYLERDWRCLHATDTKPSAENQVPYPSDYGRFRYLKSTVPGGEFLLLPRHRLTEEEVVDFTDPNAVAPIPRGFIEGETGLVGYPGMEGEVTLGYVRTVPTYADSETTLFPEKFLPLLSRTILTAYYEYDVDERSMVSIQLDGAELARLKAEENRQKAVKQRSAHGYLR